MMVVLKMVALEVAIASGCSGTSGSIVGGCVVRL